MSAPKYATYAKEVYRKPPPPAPQEIIDAWLAERYRVAVEIRGNTTAVYVEDEADIPRVAKFLRQRELRRLPLAGEAMWTDDHQESRRISTLRGAAKRGQLSAKP